MINEFFNVADIDGVLARTRDFHPISTQIIDFDLSWQRVLAEDIRATSPLPGFRRSTMDGYAIRSTDSFGASEANPAYLTVTGAITMGESPGFRIGPGEAARIATGGMLPEGADGVIMLEHTDALDDQTIEIYRSIAPGGHILEADEDYRTGETILTAGTRISSAEAGLLAAFGHQSVSVFQWPRAAIISTGDEVVPAHAVPGPGKVRDINSFTLSGLIQRDGAIPKRYGIVTDNADLLRSCCLRALTESDLLLISGGSSIGTRDFTIQVLSDLPGAEILVHGISISPGKPTILARIGNKPVFGLPGHVVSAMVVYQIVVRPFLRQISGEVAKNSGMAGIPARIARNVSSAQGRVDFIRVRLQRESDHLLAEPLLGKSGLIRTMVQADGLVRIDRDTEGLDKGDMVFVIPA